MISAAATVDDFLVGLPEPERLIFTKIRALFQAADPDITESMTYRMPTYMIGQKSVGAFNKQKNYLCLYITPAAVDPYRGELKALDCGKSCIRFKRPEQLPLAVAAKMIRAAAQLARA